MWIIVHCASTAASMYSSPYMMRCAGVKSDLKWWLYLSDAALHCKERISGNSIVKDYEIWNGIETMTHLSDTALPFRIHLVICPLKQSKLRKKHVVQICSAASFARFGKFYWITCKGSSRSWPSLPLLLFWPSILCTESISLSSFKTTNKSECVNF